MTMFNSITKTKNKTFEECRSLEVQESNQIVNSNDSNGTSALMVKAKPNGIEPQSKREISPKTNNSIKQSGLDSQSTQTNNHTPRLQVSIDFAAEQWFRILLVHLNGKNTKYKDVVEPLPSAFCV